METTKFFFKTLWDLMLFKDMETFDRKFEIASSMICWVGIGLIIGAMIKLIIQ